MYNDSQNSLPRLGLPRSLRVHRYDLVTIQSPCHNREQRIAYGRWLQQQSSLLVRDRIFHKRIGLLLRDVGAQNRHRCLGLRFAHD